MKLLPYEQLTYTTQLTHFEIKRELEEHTVDESVFLLDFFKPVKEKPYKGTVSEKYFKIIRRAFFLDQRAHPPLVIGSIHRHVDKSLVKIVIRPTVLQLAIYSLAIALITPFSLWSIITAPDKAFTWSPLLIALVMYISIIIHFNKESRAYKKNIGNILEAEEVKIL